MAKFTDQQLVQLYDGLVSDYRESLASGLSHQVIANALAQKVKSTLNPSGYTFNQSNVDGLFSLSQDEKANVELAANTIIQACATIKNAPQMSSASASSSAPTRSSPNLSRHYCCHYSCCSSYHRPVGWMYIGVYNPGPGTRAGVPMGNFSTRSQNGNTQAELVYWAIAIATISAALLSIYYLYHEMVSSAERFYYNEGWMRAAGSYLSMTASAAASAMFSGLYCSEVLFELALAAGFSSPALATVVVLLALTVIGAAVGGIVFNGLQDFMIKQTNQDAIDPADPARFRLTDSDVESWSEKMKNTIEPIKVKCAIIALRAQMGEQPVSTLSSLFSSDTATALKKRTIDSVRALRAGNIPESGGIQVGDLTFDLTSPIPPVTYAKDVRFNTDNFDFDGTPIVAQLVDDGYSGKAFT